MRRLLCACAVGALALAGCSDALVDGEWPGVSLFDVTGPVYQRPDPAGAEPASLPEGTLRMALLWSQIGPGNGPQNPLTTAAGQTVSTAEFPARYRLSLYAPPAADAIGAANGHGEVAIGSVVVYVDQDEDGAFDATADALVGGGIGRLLLYSPDGAEDLHFGAIPAGYSRMRVIDDGARGGGGNKPPATCQPGGAPAPVELDADAELPVQVDARMPDGVLLDLNCDGSREEWGGKACPPPEVVASQCGGSDPPTWPCSTCKPPKTGP